MARLLCWLGLHDWLCVYRKTWSYDARAIVGTSSSTAWICSRCDKQRTEEWDG